MSAGNSIAAAGAAAAINELIERHFADPATDADRDGEKVPLRLNLGAGDTLLEGYVNLDGKRGDSLFPLEAHDIGDFEDGSVDEIRASHVLEHFSYREVRAVVNEWARALKPGGLMKIAVPDFAKCCGALLAGDNLGGMLQGYVLGGHVDELDYHKAIFTEGTLRYYMEQAGLTGIEPWGPDAGDCSSLPISLNLMGWKGERPSAPDPDTEKVSDQGPFDWLGRHTSNRYSQFGEDGALEAIFAKLGTRNRWCFEAGAADGVFCSNTRKLVEEGWNAVWVESDPEKFGAMLDGLRAIGFDNAELSNGSWMMQRGQQVVRCWNVAVQPQGECSTEGLLRRSGAPEDPDLMVLDVDGQEFYLVNSLVTARPRALVVEFSQTAPAMFIPPLGGEGQAGQQAILNVCAAKGLHPVAQLGCNLVCVGAEDYHALGGTLRPTVPLANIGQDVAAVMTCPRLGFSATWWCISHALNQLQIPIAANNGVFWGANLTRLIEQASEAGKKYALTLDYDSVFTAADIAELYRVMETRPEIDALCPIQLQRGSGAPLFNICGRAGEPVQEVTSEELSRDTLRIRSGHFGLTMLRVESVAKLPKPWFLAHPGPDGRWAEGRVDEDIHFWRQMEAAGMQAHLACGVTIGHIDETVLWPSARDFGPVRQGIGDYNEHGRPQGVFVGGWKAAASLAAGDGQEDEPDIDIESDVANDL